MRLVCSLLLVGIGIGVPATAWAGDGVRPRTPVVWPQDTPCMSRVDRTADPVIHIDYDVMVEDPPEGEEITVDEVADGRTHQFIAMCKQRNPQMFLPPWLSQSDVDAADDKGLIGAAIDPQHILENVAFWDGCYDRVNEDADRVPISFESAAAGIDWDTTEVPEGSYTIYGYTWDPIFNMWIQKPGIVKVVDGPDSTSIGPGAAITSGEQTIYMGMATDIEGCVDAADGSMMSFFYASTEDSSEAGWEPNWVAFAEDLPIESEDFAVEFVAPEEEAGGSLIVMATFEDPMGRTFDAHMIDLVVVLKGSDPNGCDETGGSFVGNPGCNDESSGSGSGSDGSGTTAGSESTGGSTAPADGDGGDGGKDGCGCSTRPNAPASWALLLLALGLVRLKRSS